MAQSIRLFGPEEENSYQPVEVLMMQRQLRSVQDQQQLLLCSELHRKKYQLFLNL
uniref:Uncharacterized protein n=1 Tax=Medicago truncatula TaxID=3880 RepID=I3SLW1_MEDTR|nr:unknown [Medicago truncatula]